MMKKNWRRTMQWFIFLALILSGCAGAAETASSDGISAGAASLGGDSLDAASLSGIPADTASSDGDSADTPALGGDSADTASIYAASGKIAASDAISETLPESTAVNASAQSEIMSSAPELLAKAGTSRPSSPASRIAAETNEHANVQNTSKSYYMQRSDDSPLIPCLTLSDDGTFTFSYDLLSSYLSCGTYTIENGRLMARTDDGLHHFVFQAEKGQYIFLQKESSEISLIDKNIGIPVKDKAVFAPEEQDDKNQAMMVGVVKEIQEDCLIVSSVTDEFPGAFYVYFGSLDISGIRGGDKIRIIWNGNILETDPAQIYAEMIDIL